MTGQPGALQLAAALDLVRQRTGPVVGSRRVPLDEAGGCYAAAPLPVTRDVPAQDNSAVDGWAFAWSDAIGRDGAALPVAAGRSAAGHPFQRSVPAGAALRILTGAVLPDGADSVAADEICRVEGSVVRVGAGLQQGANRRRAGEDLASGSTISQPGQRLDSRHLGLAALTGTAELDVFAKLRVALLSTGDELLEPGQAMRPGAVFDANRPMLRHLLRSLPVRVTDFGIVPDDAARVEALLRDAAASADVIVASGGASAGDEDHVVRTVARIGRLDLWRIAMKPGRPIAFGQIGDATFVGLSGNPAAAFVGFLMLARPALTRLGGGTWTQHRSLPVVAGFALDKTPGRTELLRATLDAAADRPVARLVARQGSGVLSALAEADGLVELPPETVRVRPDDTVRFHAFTELLT